MNKRIQELAEQCTEMITGLDDVPFFDKEKFAELIVRECMKVARQQRNPANLNYKPSERFVEDLRYHFGVEE